MTQLNYQLPILGATNSSEDPKVHDALQEIQTVVNGELDTDNLTAALLTLLGVSSATSPRRGTVNIATQESTASTTYTTLTTPDRVSGIVLPTNGLLCVAYQATWQESVAGAARAAIFLGANQLQLAFNTGAGPVVQEASLGQAAINKPLATHTEGLSGVAGDATSYNAGDATTGQVVGSYAAGAAVGACVIFAAAGTYDVSVRFKTSSGTVSALNRKLWVWSMGF